MSHIRTQVRDVVASLLNSSPIAWGSVHKSRIQNPRQIWPYVMVFTTGETDEVISVDSPVVYSRTIGLSVIGMIRMAGNGETLTIEDKMDILALEVETKITNEAIRTILPSIESIIMTSTELEIMVTDDDIVDHAEVTIVFKVVCASVDSNPSVII